MININTYLKYNQINTIVGDFIFSSYNQPHRRYHGWKHIQRLLELLHTVGEQRFGLSSADLEFVETAILFHDIVYVPGSGSNEKESATIANMVYPDMPYLYVAICASADHTSDHNDFLPAKAKVLLDLDLWDLATERYEVNGADIRAEFYPFVGSQLEFLVGRKKWIEKMINSKQIFWIATEMETAARANLAKDLEKVQGEINALCSV